LSAQEGLQTSSPGKFDANFDRPFVATRNWRGGRRPASGPDDPPAHRQRGNNQNTNGLPHQFMPKGADLCDTSQTTPNDAVALMNNHPGKTLAWKTPAEAMADEIAAFRSTVLLDSESATCQSGLHIKSVVEEQRCHLMFF